MVISAPLTSASGAFLFGTTRTRDLRALKIWLTFLMRASLLIAGSLLASVLAFAQAPTPSDALTLQQQGNWRAAAQAWKSITERNPQDAAAFASRGVAFSNEQNYSDAS